MRACQSQSLLFAHAHAVCAQLDMPVPSVQAHERSEAGIELIEASMAAVQPNSGYHLYKKRYKVHVLEDELQPI